MLIESKSFSDITLEFDDNVISLKQHRESTFVEDWVTLDRDDAIRVATEILKRWKPEALR